MLHTITHIFQCLQCEDVFLGRRHRVCKFCRIGKTYLLVPTLLTHSLLAFEWIDSRHVEHDIRQGYSQLFGLRVLRHRQVHREREWSTGPTLRIRDRGVGLSGKNVVKCRCRVFRITTWREVYRCRECRTRICLRVLRVCPSQTEVVLLNVVCFALIARLYRREIEVYTSVILISLDIARWSIHLPRAQSIEASREGKVDVFAQNEVVSQTSDKESSRGIFSVWRHQQTRLRSEIYGEESLRNTSKVDWYIVHNQIGRTRNNLLARNNFRLGHGEVEVRIIRMVTSGIFTMTNIDWVIRHLLNLSADQPTITLLSCYALNKRLFRSKVVGYGIHSIGRTALFEDRMCIFRLALNCISLSVRIYLLGCHIYLHIIGLQTHILVVYISLIVNMDLLVQHIIVERIGILSGDNLLYHRATLLVCSRVALQHRIGGKTIRFRYCITHRQWSKGVALRLRLRLWLRQNGVAQSSWTTRASGYSTISWFGVVSHRLYDGCNGIALAGLFQHLLREWPRSGRAKHNMSYRQGDNRQNQIFQPKMFQKFQNFSYLCRQVGKNA